jgi:hypothetical protein
MRLSAESEGNQVFDVNTPQEQDEGVMRDLIVSHLSQGKAIAVTFNEFGYLSPNYVVGSFFGEIQDYLENRGFDPGIKVKNITDENGNITKSILLITRRK